MYRTEGELEAVAYSLVGAVVRDDDAAFLTLANDLCRSDLIKLVDAYGRTCAQRMTDTGLLTPVVSQSLQQKAVLAHLTAADGRN